MADDKRIEANNSGAPKNFQIKCVRCSWSRMSSGVKTDLVDLEEVKTACPTCGKYRRFRCPVCGNQSQMRRVKG